MYNKVSKKDLVDTSKEYINRIIKLSEIDSENDLKKTCDVIRGCIEICEYEHLLNMSKKGKK